MATLSVDASQVREEAARIGRLIGQLERTANRVLRAGSLMMEREVKQAMPVDTGRARASWGHWTPSDLAKTTSDSDASEADAIWDEQPLSIEQGSNLPYMERLNSGWSQQAPAGFIDAAWLRGEQRIEQAMDAALDQLLT